ncbi:hypothetical protein LWI28_009391 [Acer negundo]|uniref:Gag protein n=1 Tax=Acer negundo TaxID=4023 RepID=A0AAD5J4U1_ACENE|nr:hypothetical protein LWI28_009391 [Acer negundo]
MRGVDATHISTTSLKPLTPLKLELTVKLDHNNFLLWKQQVQAAIKDWEQQDQILLCWLLSSISQGILPELVGCSTASEVWSTVERIFSSHSGANLMQLKLQLQTLKKGGMTMTEYLTKKKSIFDTLAHIGYLIPEEDRIMYVLSGLGSEYDPFVIPITLMKSCYSMPEITALLLTHEVRIDQNMQVESLNVNMAVNKRGGNSFQANSGRGHNQNFNY